MGYVIIGASGHGRVVADMIQRLYGKEKIMGFLDDNIEIGTEIGMFKVIGKVSDYIRFHDENFAWGIGSNEIRKLITERYDIKFSTLIAPEAFVSEYTIIGEGTVVMPGAVVHTDARIGRHCIINTRAIVEHDNKIHDFVHLSSGAVLAGTVSVGTETWIGANATVKNNITIGAHCIVGAGAVVIRDVDEGRTVVGVPAHDIRC